MNTPIKEKTFFKYIFTPEELQALGASCARITQDVNELKDSAKSVASDYKAKVDYKDAQRNIVATKLNAGHEMREIEAHVHFHPAQGQKCYVHPSTGEEIKWEEMTQADHQLPMFADEL